MGHTSKTDRLTYVTQWLYVVEALRPEPCKEGGQQLFLLLSQPVLTQGHGVYPVGFCLSVGTTFPTQGPVSGHCHTILFSNIPLASKSKNRTVLTLQVSAGAFGPVNLCPLASGLASQRGLPTGIQKGTPKRF